MPSTKRKILEVLVKVRPASFKKWLRRKPTMGYLYNDNAHINFGDEEVVYKIGENSKIWDRDVEDFVSRYFIAERMIVHATVDCYVKFNRNDTEAEMLVTTEPQIVELRTHTIYINKISEYGVFHLHAEGNIII